MKLHRAGGLVAALACSGAVVMGCGVSKEEQISSCKTDINKLAAADPGLKDALAPVCDKSYDLDAGDLTKEMQAACKKCYGGKEGGDALVAACNSIVFEEKKS